MNLYRGHEPQTPPGAEAAVQALADELDHARIALEEARNTEVAAKHALGAAKRRAMFSDECPKAAGPGRTATVAERDLWVEDRIADEQLALDLATAARQAAADHLRTLQSQLSAQQSIARSVGAAYFGQRSPEW